MPLATLCEFSKITSTSCDLSLKRTTKRKEHKNNFQLLCLIPPDKTKYTFGRMEKSLTDEAILKAMPKSFFPSNVLGYFATKLRTMYIYLQLMFLLYTTTLFRGWIEYFLKSKHR